MKPLMGLILGALALVLLGSTYVVASILSDDGEGTVATSEALTIEATTAAEGTSELDVPSGACPNPNSGFVPEAAVPDFVVPGGWTEDLSVYDVNGNGLVCVKDHPARSGPRQGGVIVIDDEMNSNGNGNGES